MPKMSSRSGPEEDLRGCMIRDRFSLSKLKRNPRQVKQFQKRLAASKALVAERLAHKPNVSYPETLPVVTRLADLKAAIDKHQVVIVAGETGSGKTTQLPKLCLEMGRGVHGLIGHTQPRRVAARTVAARLSEELACELGAAVGFQIRFGDQTSDQTLIKVMTDGILLAETQTDRFLEQYDTLIIDEAHERSLNIDFLLGYIKRILPKRPDLKVIITSATIDLERFSAHFSRAPIVEVTGRTYPVEVRYRPLESGADEDVDSVHRGILAALDEVKQLEKQHRYPGGVLIFLAGEREIREVAQLLRRKWPVVAEILPLYSRLTAKEQNRVFSKLTQLRVVLATNVAETSLTVPGIRYVIDPGNARVSRYSVTSKIQRLPIEPISKASADQRKGRCGRISDGVCFRLYAEEDFLSRPDFTTPEILRTNLAAVLLQMLKLRLGDPAKFPFIERPEQRQLSDGFQLLTELQAIDSDRRLTRIGRDLADFSVDLRLARALVEANRFGCLKEVLIIASGLAVQDPRERPITSQQKADEAHREWHHGQSDFMDLVNLWQGYERERQERSQSELRKYCRQHFLSFMRMREWRDIHTQLVVVCKEKRFRINRGESDYEQVHRALLPGYLGQVAERTDKGDYAGARNRRYHIFPGSSVVKRRPKWLMAAALVETSRLFARINCEIQPEWVEQAAAHLVKRRYFEPFFDAKRGQVLCFEEVSLFGVVLVKKRQTDYANIDPEGARSLFIHEALVEQQLVGRFGFLVKNQQLIDEIERLESKSRKRDLLVDQKRLHEFYESKLPSNVVSEIELAGALKANRNLGQQLRLSRDFLLQKDVQLSGALYPDALTVGENALPLNYAFDPAATDDGVTVDVPLALLNQVSAEELDWLVPGLLPEKCLALIRSLPKNLRKNFVPAPAFAERALEGLDKEKGSLRAALADRLFRLSGVRIAAGDFQVAALDKHLSIQVRILDEKGQVVGAGRNLEILFEQFKGKVTTQSDQHELNRKALKQWDFEALPEVVTSDKGGIHIKGFPALVDRGQEVDLVVFDDVERAETSHPHGVTRLLMLALPDQVKYLQKQLPGLQSLGLQYAARGDAQRLLSALVQATFRHMLVEGRPSVRSLEEFKDRVADRSKLFDHGQRLVASLGEALTLATQVELRLQGLSLPVLQPSTDDIRRQLKWLLRDGFVEWVDADTLLSYPRYLKALNYRCDKLEGNLAREQAQLEKVIQFEKRLEAYPHREHPRARAFEWLLQEYRVSVFAQPIGTRFPISEKRLEKAWLELQ